MPTESYSGDGSFDVPSGVDTVTVRMYGEDGGNGDGYIDGSPGGAGGYVEGEVDVSSVTTIYVRNSPGGESYAGVGGDGIWISIGGTAIGDRVAAVGGGGGGGASDTFTRTGGDGGGDVGADGTQNGSTDGYCGKGGSQESGGAGGDFYTNGYDGSDGDASGGGGDYDDTYGGGGGGGYYGGGQGSDTASSNGWYPGGGGSSYDDGLSAVFANEQGSSNSRSHGNGALVEFTYLVAPDGVSVDATGYRSADLSWNAVNGVDEYRIYRDGSQVGTTTSTSFTDTGLSPTTSYDWYVTAVESGAESDPSSTVSGTTGGDAPGGLSVSIDGTDATLSWADTNGDEDGYEVHRSTSVGVDTSGAPLATTPTNVESYQDAGLADGTQYYWRVVAVRNGERGNDSAEATGLTPLPAPTGLTVDDVRDVEADLSWNVNSPDVTEQRVYVKRWNDDGGADRQRTGMDFVSGDYVALNHSMSGQKYDQLTVSAWFRTSTDNVQFASHDRSEFYRFGVGSTATKDKLSFNCNTPDGISDLSGDTTVTDGQLHHAAVVYDTGDVTFYLDGQLDGSATGVGSPLGSSLTRYGFIGTGSEASTFDGNKGPTPTGEPFISDFTIAYSAWSQSQIQSAMDGNIPSDGLQGHWPMDLNRSGVTPDLSPYANDGDVNGPTLTGPSVVDDSGALSGWEDEAPYPEVWVKSAGYSDGNFTTCRFNGSIVGGDGRGINTYRFDGGGFVEHNNYDTYPSEAESDALASYINSLPAGETIAAGVDDEGRSSLTQSAIDAFESRLSSIELRNLSNRDSWAIVGVVDGEKYGEERVAEGNGTAISYSTPAPTEYTLDGLLNGERYETFVHGITDDNEVRNQ